MKRIALRRVHGLVFVMLPNVCWHRLLVPPLVFSSKEMSLTTTHPLSSDGIDTTSLRFALFTYKTNAGHRLSHWNILCQLGRYTLVQFLFSQKCDHYFKYYCICIFHFRSLQFLSSSETSLYSPGWPRICYVDQSGVKLTEIRLAPEYWD